MENRRKLVNIQEKAGEVAAADVATPQATAAAAVATPSPAAAANALAAGVATPSTAAFIDTVIYDEIGEGEALMEYL